IGFCYFY
ncbi:hypothetical protein BVZ80_01768B, partial [Haemophilus influenzae]